MVHNLKRRRGEAIDNSKSGVIISGWRDFRVGIFGVSYRAEALGNRRNKGAFFCGHLIGATAHGRRLVSPKVEGSNSRGIWDFFSEAC